MTYCADCKHVHPESGGAPWTWMCSKHERREGYGFVTKEVWDKFPPFLYCKDVNGGACPLYEERENET